ncbi:MAG: YrhK family protein [Ornithinimicrobium sp.]
MTVNQPDPSDLDVHIGSEELIIRDRFEALSILNDVLIAVFFIAGSLLFFSESTAYAGTWLFLLGSIELLIRPVIRLSRRVRLQRITPRTDSGEAAGGDF